MNGRRIRTSFLIGGLLLAAGMAVGLPGGVGANAQSAHEYALSWWTVDGGGITPGDRSGYTLGGAAGQPDAAVWSGQEYVLAGGFWAGVAVEYPVYLPVVLRNA